MLNTYVPTMAKQGSGGDRENMRTRIEGPLRDKWQKMLEERQITQQRAVIALIEMIVEMDPLAQALILKQIPADDADAITKIVLKRVGSKRTR